jgi:hypothetical protein
MKALDGRRPAIAFSPEFTLELVGVVVGPR